MSISAVVLTKNEDKNLKDCLESIAWCDEVIVIDDNSQDKTVEIAQKFGAKLFKRSLAGNFAAQRNFGLKKAKGDWVLFVDADERVSPDLKSEILRYIDVSHCGGYYLKRRDYFGGREIKHGETSKVRLLRLAKKDAGSWQRKVHETWQVKGRVGELTNPLLHYPHQTITDYLNEINHYSTLHAQSLHDEKSKPGFLKIVLFPLVKFLRNYIFRLGFLDGSAGLIVAIMMSLHSFLAHSKHYLAANKQ